MTRWIQHNQRGQTLVDLTVALALMALTVTSAGTVATLSSRVGNEAGRRSQATALAARELEAYRNYRDSHLTVGGDPWYEGCYQFVMVRQADSSWQKQCLSELATPAAEPVSYTDTDELGEYSGFARLVTVWDGADYHVNGTPGTPTAVKNVLVKVSWEESNGSRSVEFRSLMTDWKQF